MSKSTDHTAESRPSEWLRAFEAALSVEGVTPEQATRVANILVPTRQKYPTRGICWADLP